MNKIEICRKVVEDQQYIKITVKDKNNKNRRIVLDLFTSSKIVNLYDQVKEETKNKMVLSSWEKLLIVASKC